jgi:hypothetical protein
MERNWLIPATLAFVLLAGLGTASPAAAEMCSTLCSTSVLCSTECEVCRRGTDNPDGSCSNGTQWTTCGGAGYPCTTCFSQWQDSFRVQTGAYDKSWFFYCELFAVYDVYQTDANHCQPNRVVCDDVLVGRGYGIVDCCVGGQCWGRDSC